MAYRDDILADTPRAYFRLGEASGTFQDETANGFTATGTDIIYGATGAIAGDVDKAAWLRQTATAFGRLATDVLFLQPHVDAPMSLEGWFHPLKIDGRDQPLIVQRAGATNEHALASVITSNNKFGLRVGTSSGFTQYESALDAVQGVWYHVVAVYDGTRCQLHVDGVEVLDVLANASSLGADVTVGAFRDEDGMDGNFTYHFAGYVDEVALYQYALTEAQALAHNDSGRGIVPPIGTGTPTVAFEQSLVRLGNPTAVLSISVFALGNPSAAFTQTVGPATGKPATVLQQAVYATARPAAAVQQYVYALAAWTGGRVTFRMDARIGGADFTSRLVDQITVRAEEGGSRTAEFSVSPETGVVTPLSWVGADVALDYLATPADGTESRWRLFTGAVDHPTWSPTNGRVKFTNADGLQQRFNRLARDRIEAIIAGQWSAALSDPDAEGWSYAQDRMRSRDASLDLSPSGAVRVTPWAAKGSADITLTAADLLDATPRVRFAEHRNVVNTVTLRATYRHDRTLQRERTWRWNYGREFCDYYQASSTLPNKSMVRAAAEGTGWQVDSIHYTPMWPSISADFVCPSIAKSLQWVNDQPEIVIGAQGKLVKRWAQTVDEVYTIELVAPASVNGLGAVPVAETVAATTAFDAESYEVQQAAAVAFSTGVATAIPDVHEVGAAPPPAGAVVNTWGDYQLDRDDDDDRAGLLRTAMAIQRARILETHRDTDVVVETPLLPWVDTRHTVRVETPSLVAQGKVRIVEHRIDLRAGRAVTEITIAISSAHGSAVVNDWDGATLPAPPDTLPAPPSSELFSTRLNMTTQLGGRENSPPFRDDEAGYAGNYILVPPFSSITWTTPTEASETEPGAEVYPVRFAIDTPTIETEVRDPVTGTRNARVEIAIPDDELTLIAP